MAEHEKNGTREAIARDLDLTFDQIERKLLMPRRGFAIERGRDKAYLLAFAWDYRQGRAIVMAEGGLGLLCGHRQRYPCLKAEQAAAAATRFGSGPLRMRHAPAGGHPVDLTGSDRLQRTQAVAVEDLARQ